MADDDTMEDLAKNLLADSDTRIRFQHEYTLAGYKTLFLLQGGAIIALLTYAGHNPEDQVTHNFSGAFSWYLAGLVLTVLAYLTAYISQGAFARMAAMQAFRIQKVDIADKRSVEWYEKAGNIAVLAGVALCVLSLLAFVMGSWCAYDAMLHAPASSVPMA